MKALFIVLLVGILLGVFGVGLYYGWVPKTAAWVLGSFVVGWLAGQFHAAWSFQQSVGRAFGWR